ncbi:protein takeout-like [Musca autumnalis]|uniref:protein takeout-like n=1 Tax=Musca autumnalis TaxID=221902 RepID=UPI003CEF46B4
MKFTTFICGIFIFAAVKAEYPADFPKCKNGDSTCLKNAANEVVKKFYTGKREVNLVSFDPLRIKIFELERNPSSPVNVGFKFTNVELLGLKNMQVTLFDGLNADMKGRNHFEATVPEVTLKGDYDLEGNVLVLPIVGKGKSEIKMQNIQIKYSFEFAPYEKNGQTYVKIERVKLELIPGKAHFYFGNLFNGDEALGASTNMFINENSADITKEILPSITKSLSLLIQQLINGFYQHRPYAELFA